MRKRIKILQLQSDSKLAGTEVSTERLIRNMNKDEFENDICFFFGDGPIAEKYRENKFKVDLLNFDGKNILSVAHKLNKIIKEGKYDIINIYGYKINILGRILASINGVKNVITAQRSIDGQRKWIHSYIDRITSRFVKLYISNSEAARQVLIKRERISSDKIITIHNGIDIENYQLNIDRNIKLEQLEIKHIDKQSKLKIISVVGNLLTPKGHTYLIDAINILKDEGVKDFIVLFAGEGNLRKNIEEKISHFELDSEIKLLGSRKDIPEILSISDIFVLPSIWEGLPGSVIEAMASNLPVVATNVGGVSELIINNETGFIVDAYSPKALADKIKVLLENEKLRITMGNKGFDTVVKKFSLEKMVYEYEMAYKKVVS